MDIRLVSLNHGIKDERVWGHASFKLSRDDGKSVIISEWLNDKAAQQAIQIGAESMPLVDVKLEYGRSFKPTIVDIRLKDNCDEDLSFE